MTGIALILKAYTLYSIKSCVLLYFSQFVILCIVLCFVIFSPFFHENHHATSGVAVREKLI